MATELNARQDRHGTIAFTLPISCQICLGKVKQPVLCPSNHVFCSQCMNVWLQRNKQCPACRTPINPGNPVKKILGGLSHTEDDKDKMSNPDLRKARFDLLFREYEDEFERLNSEVQLLRTENEALRQQLQKESGTKAGPKDKYGVQSAKSTETNGLLMLTKKLQDAQKLYEKVKTELAKHKEENNSLKDENVNLNRENQRLRVEISNRSPHRYGRTTVATLESKIQSYEKEVGQLNKALEKSDKYIEDLQKELQESKKNPKSASIDTGNTDYLSSYSSKISSEAYSSARNGIDSRSSSSVYGVGADHPSKRQLFNGNDMDSTDKSGVSSSGRKSYVNGDLMSDKGGGASSGRTDYVNGDLYKHEYKDTNMYSSGRKDYTGTKSTKYDGDDDDDEVDDYYKTRSSSKSKGVKSNGKNGKRVTFDIPKDRNETTSFDLEMPSPVKALNRSLNETSPSPVKGVLKNGKKSKYGSSDSLNISKPSSLGDSFSTDRVSSQKYSKDDSDLIHSQSSTYSRSEDLLTRPRSSGADYYSDKRLNDSFSLEQPDRKSGRYRDNLDDTQTIESELDELNISVTPDFTDCMKLLNRAEKKVHDHVEPYEESDPLYGTYKSRDYLDEYQSTKDKLSTDYKSRDPLLSDYTSARTNSYSKPENTYTSDYPSASGGISTYKSSYSAAANDGGYTRSSYPPSSIDDHTKDYTSMYSSSRTGSDIPGSQYSATSSTGSHSTYTTSTVEGLNKHYPSAKLGDNRYNSLATDNTGGYKSGYGKASSLDNPVPTSNNLDYTSKYLSSSKPLSQSGFGRSPSVDNLFMSKPSHDTGKRYATAEDLPSDYKSRRSLPSYSSAAGDKKGRLSAAAAVGSDVGSGASRDYKISSALPPKPVRTRSYSDMGTSVSSLPSTHLKGKGNIYSSASNTVDVSSAQTLSDPLDEPHYNMSYSSKYTSMTSSNPTLAYGDEHNYHNSVSSSRFGDGASSAVTLNTNTEPVYSALPPKPKTGYSYTDVDLGVNPRNKSSFGDTVSLRGRSASVDLPVSELKSSYDTNEMYSKYSDSKPYISENPDSAYTLSLTGVSSRPGSLDDGYTSTALPSRYSSSSSTAYMPSSLTSVTSSATFSLANPSTSYPSSSMSVTSSTYPMKPLDMIQETSGRGYSYLSNNSSLGDISKSDSFLPEPKKRLFESGDDLDLSLSPIKATRKI